MAASGITGTFCQIVRNAKGNIESIQFCPSGSYCCREAFYDITTCCNDVTKKIETQDLIPAGHDHAEPVKVEDCMSMMYFWIGMGCFLAVTLLLLLVVACVVGKMRSSSKQSQFSKFDDGRPSGNRYAMKMTENGESREDVGAGNVNYAGPGMA